MKLTVVVWLLFVVGFLDNGLVPQDSSSSEPIAESKNQSTEKLPDAESILEAAILAGGGYEVLGSISNSHFVSEGVSGQGEDYTYEYYKAKGKFFARFTYSNGTVLERGVVSDGTLTEDGKRSGAGWHVIDGSVREMHGDELQEYLRRRTSVKSGEAKDKRFKSATCVGREEVNGKAAFKLVLIDHDGTEIKKFYDVESGLVLRRICDEEFNGRKREVVRDYFDNQLVGQQMVSQRQTVAYDQEVWNYTTKLYEVDIEMPDGVFEIPSVLASKIKKGNADKK